MEACKVNVDWQGGTMDCHLEEAYNPAMFPEFEKRENKPQTLVCKRLGIEASLHLPFVRVDMYDMEEGKLSICMKQDKPDGSPNCKDIKIDPKEVAFIAFDEQSGGEVTIFNRGEQNGKK